jgi:hypothetical protein
MTTKCDHLVFDISSLLYRSFYAMKSEDDVTIAGLACHSALQILNKYYKLYKPSQRVVMAFDRKSWRVDYMESAMADGTALSTKPYKGNRRQNLTPKQQIKYNQFKQHLRELEELISNHTTITTLAGEMLEADDLIAGYVRMHKDDQVIVISSDSDLLQLMRHGNVTIITPATGDPQVLDDWFDDPDYYTFQKCIRGDDSDNIQSAYPGVRSDKIREAYLDPYHRANLMNQTWDHPSGVKYRVGDLFEENELLIHLDKQPDVIVEMIESAIMKELQRDKNFSLLHFMKFLSKYQMNKIRDNVNVYIKMLSA